MRQVPKMQYRAGHEDSRLNLRKEKIRQAGGQAGRQAGRPAMVVVVVK